MTKFIINPENHKTVSIFSREGKRVLGNYLWTLKQMGGSLRKLRRRHKRCKSCGRRKQYGGFFAEGSGGVSPPSTPPRSPRRVLSMEEEQNYREEMNLINAKLRNEWREAAKVGEEESWMHTLRDHPDYKRLLEVTDLLSYTLQSSLSPRMKNKVILARRNSY